MSEVDAAPAPSPAPERPDRVARIGDLIGAGVLLAIAAGVAVIAQGLPDPLVAGEIGAGDWPTLLAVALAALMAVLIVQTLLGRGGRGEDPDPVAPGRLRVLAGALGLLVLLLVVWPRVGYLPTTVVVLSLLARLVGVGGWVRSIAMGSGLALFTWALFDQLLRLPL